MKRKLLAATMAVVMTASLTACTGGGTPPATEAATTKAATSASQAENQTSVASDATEEKITLSLCWWGNQIRNDVTKKAVDLYMSQNPNVEIKVEFTDWTGYWDKLSAMAAGGNLPDIIQQDYGYISQYQKSGQLADLTPFIEDGTIQTENIPQSVIESGSIDGKCYALSLGSTVPMMLYDKAIVQEAGVVMPDQMTMDELFAICQTIYEKTGVHSYYDDSFVMLQMVARGRGSHLFDELPTGEASSSLKQFELIDRFSNEEFFIPMDLLAEKGANVVETRPIIDQTTWNDFSFSNLFNSFVTTSGREMGMTMYPLLDESAENPMFLKPSMFFSISETSEHKEEAAKFIDWFINSTECNEILLAERGVPVNTEVAESIKALLDDTTQTVFDYVAKAGQVATAIDAPDPAGKAEIESLRQEMIDNLYYEEMTAEEAAKQFAESSRQILEEATQ